MRVTVCELPHEPRALAVSWLALCDHAESSRSELVLLPEFAGSEAVWESQEFDQGRWNAAEALGEELLRHLPELGVEYVVGTRAVSEQGRRLNQGYLWSRSEGLLPLRSKYYMPEEPWSWEATWCQRGDPAFPVFHAGSLSFGLNICTELWALETYAAYASLGADMILSPRATAFATTTRWVSAGVVAAMRSGAFSVSSNRVDPTGRCGGHGWIIDPMGEVVALTSSAEPFATREIDLVKAAKAKRTYPRYVFAD